MVDDNGLEGSGRGLIEAYPSTFLEGLRKTTKASTRVTGVSAEIGTKHLQNTTLELYL
jgi:hypothetical protein